MCAEYSFRKTACYISVKTINLSIYMYSHAIALDGITADYICCFLFVPKPFIHVYISYSIPCSILLLTAVLTDAPLHVWVEYSPITSRHTPFLCSQI